MSDVEFSVHDGQGRIMLNRPRAINALSLEMLQAIEHQVTLWFAQGNIVGIELAGAGERGYCAGADVRQLRELALQDQQSAVSFLRAEYRLDGLLATSPVPLAARLNGISMGGGLGLAMHGQHRLGSADTRWAMPEVGIGLWPDVGLSFELSRCPGQIGVHLAMTGQTIDGASALFAGLLDEAPDTDPARSALAQNAEWIAECYVGNDPAAIVAALENHPNPAARETAVEIRSKCPLSVAVALEAIRRAELLPDVSAVLNQDLTLAKHFMADSDFAEGVRAQLVDRDHRPSWRHSSIEAVTRQEVLAMFS